MSNEEFEKRFEQKMEFILDQQAQFASDIQQLRETQATTENLLGRLAAVTTAGFKEMNEKVSSVIDAQIRTEENVLTLTGNVSGIAGNVSSLTGHVSSLTGHVSSLTEDVSSLTGNVSSLTENVSSLAENVSSLTEKISAITERMNELAEAQAHTDQRLNVIIDIISEDRNGRSRN